MNVKDIILINIIVLLFYSAIIIAKKCTIQLQQKILCFILSQTILEILSDIFFKLFLED